MNIKVTLAAALLLVGMASAAFADPLTPADSGHYRAAGLERQGVVLLVWPEQPSGRRSGALVSWYTYEPGGPGPMWLLSGVIEQPGEWVNATLCAGAFPGLEAGCEEAGELRVLKSSSGAIRMEYFLPALGDASCDPRPQPSPVPPVCAGVLFLQRLTPPIL